MSAQVSPDPAGRAGFALIRVGGAAAALPDPRFKIQGPDERAPYLGKQGWQPADTLLAPRNAWTDGADLVLEIGPDVVDVVEDGTVGFAVPAARVNQTLIWPVLTPSRGSGQNVFQQGGGPPPPPQKLRGEITGAKTPEVPVPEPKPAPQSLPEPERRNTKLDPVPPRFNPLLIVAGVLVLALVAGGAWYFMHRQATQQNFVTNAQPPPAQPAAPVQPASDCDAEPYPAVLQCEHDPAKLTQIAQSMMQAGNAAAGIAVFHAAADDPNNYGPAALALAEYYDPATFQPNAAISAADPAIAARYYKLAVRDGDQDAAAPRQKLYQLLQGRAGAGDIQAPNTLSDYWP